MIGVMHDCLWHHMSCQQSNMKQHLKRLMTGFPHFADTDTFRSIWFRQSQVQWYRSSCSKYERLNRRDSCCCCCCNTGRLLPDWKWDMPAQVSSTSDALQIRLHLPPTILRRFLSNHEFCWCCCMPHFGKILQHVEAKYVRVRIDHPNCQLLDCVDLQDTYCQSQKSYSFLTGQTQISPGSFHGPTAAMHVCISYACNLTACVHVAYIVTAQTSTIDRVYSQNRLAQHGQQD